MANGSFVTILLRLYVVLRKKKFLAGSTVFTLVNCLLLWSTGYQTAYSQLAFAGRKERDPFSGTIPDAKIYLAQSLQKLSSGDPGKVRCCSVH